MKTLISSYLLFLWYSLADDINNGVQGTKAKKSFATKTRTFDTFAKALRNEFSPRKGSSPAPTVPQFKPITEPTVDNFTYKKNVGLLVALEDDCRKAQGEQLVSAIEDDARIGVALNLISQIRDTAKTLSSQLGVTQTRPRKRKGRAVSRRNDK